MSPVERVDSWLDRLASPRLLITLACIAAALSVAAIVTASIAYQTVSAQVSRNTETARQSCLRTIRFAPAIADDLDHRHVLTGAVLHEYRSTIPLSCPK